MRSVSQRVEGSILHPRSQRVPLRAPVRAPIPLRSRQVNSRATQGNADLFSFPSWFSSQALFAVLFFALAVFASMLSPAQVYAEELQESYYTELHDAYVELARSDPQVAEQESWEDLLEEASAFAGRELREDISAKTMFLLARIHEHQYRVLKSDTALNASVEWSERVLERYPRSEEADNALYSLAELERIGRKDKAAAKAAYQRLLDEYPESVFAEKAAQQLGVRQPKKKKPGLLAKLFGSKKNKEKQEQSQEAEASAPFSLHPLSQRFPRQPVVVIDPGHGGEEEGAFGSAGVNEKEVVLNISLMLEELLRKRLNVKTVLTRVRDVTVELSERTELANQVEADLFVSVHANASPAKSLSGVETYYLDNTNDKSSLRLAKRENAASAQHLSDLGFMLSDLIQNAKLDDSIALAHYIQEAVVRTLRTEYPDIRDLGVKRAPFFVLVGAHMPCVLAEVSFIDHKIEGKRLSQRSYQQLVASALFDGILEFLEHRWLPSVRSQAAVGDSTIVLKPLALKSAQ